jgi:polyisoprenyl-phosphate glycosyltransferase
MTSSALPNASSARPLKSGKESKPSVSFVIPVYNERPNIPRLLAALDSFVAACAPKWFVRFDAIFIDDGSSDGSREVLLAAERLGLPLRIIRFSRNFGKELALSAGLRAATSDAVVLMDSDLQHPLDVVEQFLQGWLNEDYDVVYAYRSSTAREATLKRVARRLYYRIMSGTGQFEVLGSVGDFQLLSRRAYEAINQLGEHERFMKGLYRWIGFRQKGVPYAPLPRYAGETKYSIIKLWALAINGITSFTTLPLRIATWTGIVLALCSAGYALFTIVQKLVLGNDVPGYPTLVTLIGFIGAGQFLVIGIIGEYLAKVLLEVKHRPLYLVESDEVVLPAHATTIVEAESSQ